MFAGLDFASPEYAWLIPAAVLLSLVRARLRSRTYIATTTLVWLEAVLGRPSRLRGLPWFMTVMAFVLIVIAMMQPQLPFAEREIRSLGLDIVLVLDLSESMQEVMSGDRVEAPAPAQRLYDLSMTPTGRTRLDTTRDALRHFISRRQGDRIGLVVFSDNAYVVSPLTLDYDYLFHYLDMIDADILRGERMTAIGDGINLAHNLLYRQGTGEPRSQAILVFTDGEHNTGRDPLEIIPEVHARGIRVHAVGVDIEASLREKEKVQQLIDTIRELGGSYFDADSEQQLISITDTLDAMEKQQLVSRQIVREEPVFHWFALPAAMLLLIAMLLRSIPWFSDYT